MPMWPCHKYLKQAGRRAGLGAGMGGECKWSKREEGLGIERGGGAEARTGEQEEEQGQTEVQERQEQR